MGKKLSVGDRVKVGDWPYWITRDGEIFSEQSGKVLKGGFSSTGYRAAILCYRGDRMKVMHHQLVARAFIGPQVEGIVVNHKNGIKTDNRAENLEYCTPKENREHAKRNGLYTSGERCSWAKLTSEKARAIRDKHRAGVGIMTLSREYGVNKKAISQIISEKTWRNA
jgi:hypothetical protein